MSKKSAELTSNLVAIKGSAIPAPDMHGRLGSISESHPPVPTQPAKKEKAATTVSREVLMPLNFRISAPFRREFKTYAATHDLKLNELLRRCFESYRKTQGD